LSEEWRPVVGWEGLYEVSSRGRLRVLDRKMRTRKPGVFATHPGKIMSPDYENNGNHGRVFLVHRDRSERTWIHRIVARAFIGEPPPDKPLVLHWDDDPKNNNVENLRYGNTQDNVDDAIRNGVHPGSVTQCPRGHKYTPDNLIGTSAGNRRCRTCELESDRKRHFEKLDRGIPRDDARHGSYAGYRAGCRCDPCYLANRDYKREYGRLWRARKRLSV
jgi:hypothetical protein